MNQERQILKIERHTIQTDGIKIPSVIITPASPCGTAVFLHGYGGCKEEHLGFAWRIAEIGLRSCVIDLRGHGENLQYLDFGVLSDVEAVINNCRPLGKVVVIGHSLGGRLALLSSADFAIGISPALNQHYSETTQNSLMDMRSYRVRLDSSEMILDILKSLPLWIPQKRQQTSIIFGSRDIPEIVHACQKLSPSDTNVNFIKGALHSDIFLLEKTFGIVLNQLSEWFGLN